MCRTFKFNLFQIAVILVLGGCSVKQSNLPEEKNSAQSAAQPEEVQQPLNEEAQKEVELNEEDLVATVLEVAEAMPGIIESAPDVADTTSNLVKILRPGTFHADEVWEDVEREKWFGLMFKDGGFLLREIEINAVRVVDGLMDDPETGEKTGWEINAATGEDVIVFVTNLIGLSNRKAMHADVPTEVFPGDTVEFNFFGVRYSLFATGHDDVMNEVHKVSDYKLYLSCLSEQAHSTELLVSHSEFDDAMTSILWVGDIDGDLKPDILLDLSDHYNVREPALFLSSLAAPGHLLRFAANHRTVGC